MVAGAQHPAELEGAEIALATEIREFTGVYCGRACGDEEASSNPFSPTPPASFISD